MASFPFVAPEGTSWLAVPGLPAEHPEAGAGPFAELTFHSARGETRVLPPSAFPYPRVVDPRVVDLRVVPFGRGPRASAAAVPDWGPLLAQATPWPPGPAAPPPSSAA